tara:strand:- start:245 stop:463 length:219 start_codon:yes stop_codon:yes gene_type:complete
MNNFKTSTEKDLENFILDNSFIKNRKNLKKNIKDFLFGKKLSFLEIKMLNSKIKKLPRPTDLIKIKNQFMNN